MTSSYIIIGVLMAALIGASRMRLLSLLSMYQIQAILLAVYALILGYSLDENALYVSVFFVIAFKVIAIPMLFNYAARHGMPQKLHARARPAVLLVLSAVIIAFGIATAVGLQIGSMTATAVALSLMMLGFLGLIARTDLFGQSIGFLTLENGIFVLGLSVAHGLPLFVELGVYLDVLVGVVLFVALISRAHRENKSVETDELKDLIG